MDQMTLLFLQQISPTVHVCSSIKDVLQSNELSDNHFDDKNIITCVGSSNPESFYNDNQSILKLGSNIFELQFISLFQQTTSANNCSSWHYECYSRHGGGYTSWWFQMRGDHLPQKYLGDIVTNLHQHLIRKDSYFINCSYVYVKRDNTFTNLWQQRIFRCMGSKTHVTCQCNNMPFIPTNTRCEAKQKCIQCTTIESFICCSLSCSARLCKKCYEACSIAYVTTINPPDRAINDTNGVDIDNDFDNDNDDHDNPDEDDAHGVPSVGTCNDQDILPSYKGACDEKYNTLLTTNRVHGSMYYQCLMQYVSNHPHLLFDLQIYA
jgi:hypothetical protein